MSYLLIDLNSIYKSVLKEFDSFSCLKPKKLILMGYIMNDFDNNFETIIAMDCTVERYNRHLKKPEYRVLNILKQHNLKIIGYSLIYHLKHLI